MVKQHKGTKIMTSETRDRVWGATMGEIFIDSRTKVQEALRLLNEAEHNLGDMAIELDNDLFYLTEETNTKELNSLYRQLTRIERLRSAVRIATSGLSENL